MIEQTAKERRSLRRYLATLRCNECDGKGCRKCNGSGDSPRMERLLRKASFGIKRPAS